MNWVAKQIRAQRTGRVAYNRTTIPGTDQWEFVHPDLPYPIGILTVRWVGKATLDILYVFVDAHYRRCGIATRMLDHVKKHYGDGLKEIITGGVNRYSRSWLAKLGFEQVPQVGHWRRLFAAARPEKSKSKSRKS